MKRDFKGIWVERKIWTDNTISCVEKCILLEIDSLDGEDGCFATNAHFQEFFGISPATVTRSIKKLEEKGMIHVTYNTSKKGMMRVINLTGGSTQNDEGGLLNLTGGSPQNDEGSYNNKSINIDKQEDNIPFLEIIDLLNRETGKHYQARSTSTKRLIKARWREGFRIPDFKKVIRKKSAEWGKDPKMSSYLRPETLFGTKFESYLNQTDNMVDPETGIWIGHMKSQEEKTAWMACRKANGGRPPMSREEVLEFMRRGA